jgi:ketol-acid reductoisomerase
MERRDSNLEAVKRMLGELSIAVIGYGIQGRAQARNLRDSGLDLRLGLRPGGMSWAAAREDGWKPRSIPRAVRGADIVALLVPDSAHERVFAEQVAPALEPGATLVLAHGFSVLYERLSLPADLGVALVAPKLSGGLVRELYLAHRGVPCLVAVHRDPRGRARERALAYARAIGATEASAIESSFAEETETDLFGEQAVMVGGLTELLTAGYETLVEAGYRPELAYLECFHKLKLVADQVYDGGLARLHRSVSETARYGDLTRGPRVINDETRARMREVLDDIRSGRFAREWVEEHGAGKPNFERLLIHERVHPSEIAGRRLRWRMSQHRDENGDGPTHRWSQRCRGCWKD